MLSSIARRVRFELIDIFTLLSKNDEGLGSGVGEFGVEQEEENMLKYWLWRLVELGERWLENEKREGTLISSLGRAVGDEK